MAASSSKSQAPFLTYLTVFKSRLSVVNLVMPITGLTYTPAVGLSRRLKGILTEEMSLAVTGPISEQVFRYLLEKKFIGGRDRKSARYSGWTASNMDGRWVVRSRDGRQIDSVSVLKIDAWMSDPSLRSTVGVPTAENTDEILELCFQLNLLSRLKCTWTAAGQLVDGLRKKNLEVPTSPMRLGIESVALLRQVIAVDGLIIRELLREIISSGPVLRRDVVALQLSAVVRRALEAAKTLRVAPPLLTEGKRFLELVNETTKKRDSASRAPGVLEHRTAPRLEWLCDFGAVTKAGRPKNSFEYEVTPDATLLLKCLEHVPPKGPWGGDAALEYWRGSESLSALRCRMPAMPLRDAILDGYRVMKRSVGPASIRDTCFAALVLAPGLRCSINEATEEILEWASVEKELTVSGGRYTRSPELVHFGPSMLGS